jgi:ppGpp synthetase/RelA/SpoT-type nucleotidyltranferase
MKVNITDSTNPKKKLMAIFFDANGKKIKTTHFGQDGADDYTITNDKEQRTRYRIRHKKDLDTNDYKKAGYLSYHILWGSSTSLQENIKKYKKRFNLS